MSANGLSFKGDPLEQWRRHRKGQCHNVTMATNDNNWRVQELCNIGGEPNPGFVATGTKLGEQFSCSYFDT